MRTSATSTPLVSVIVPTYNAERYVKIAVASILREETVALEVIVVNDGSSDRSVEQVQSFNDPRVRIVDNDGKGVANAINTGLLHARGVFFARCDADDLYPANRLSRQVSWLKNHPDFSAICGTYTAIDSGGKTVVNFQCGETETEITSELQNGVTRTHFGTFLLKTDLLRQIGGCRTYFTTGEDIDAQLRLSEQGRVWYSPDINYLYRLHAASLTHTQGSAERVFYNQVARTLQVQRKAGGLDDLSRNVAPPRFSPNPTKVDLPYTSSEHIQGLLLYRAWKEHQAGQRRAALVTGMKAVAQAPMRASAWTSLVALMVKTPAIE